MSLSLSSLPHYLSLTPRSPNTNYITSLDNKLLHKMLLEPCHKHTHDAVNENTTSHLEKISTQSRYDSVSSDIVIGKVTFPPAIYLWCI